MAKPLVSSCPIACALNMCFPGQIKFVVSLAGEIPAEQQVTLASYNSLASAMVELAGAVRQISTGDPSEAVKTLVSQVLEQIKRNLESIDSAPALTQGSVIISYRLGDLRLMLRYETDRYVDVTSTVDVGVDPLSSMIESLSLHSTSKLPHMSSTRTALRIKKQGQTVPTESTLKIKTRVFHKQIDLQEVLPQLWVSQTPNLVRAYHRNGVFELPRVKDVTPEIKKWDNEHQEDLMKLATIIKRIIKVVKESGEKAVVKYNGQHNELVVWKAEGRQLLPHDIYFKLNNQSTVLETNTSSANRPETQKTKLKFGGVLYDIDLSMIPYLRSFVDFQRRAQPQVTKFDHGAIPLFDVALKGNEIGYRHCFRSLPADLSQYYTLCGTYDFLGVDVLGQQSIDDIFVDLRACKTTYELDYKRDRTVKGNKTIARNAAFRLMFLIVIGKFHIETNDCAKFYNAVLFVVSHPGTFKWRTRILVLAAYKERFLITSKQSAQLDQWCRRVNHGSEDEGTTDEKDSEPYYSDSS
ncbi:geranylgeranyl pyrophosphate synthetase [Aspergillus affinis]|uniref:geranylgeranyl pyrophosphate synthetase n=1 Tax=Aspergillus affinis TaxID=1070780 RepID=UPI0022FE58B8|nr:geranylgeranyl pyrophosphate synthetase [Aspergillus affinis]KAI9042484.1 geranylgeranyl pyrophosphate synthetase [Aspergillus affinis]